MSEHELNLDFEKEIVTIKGWTMIDVDIDVNNHTIRPQKMDNAHITHFNNGNITLTVMYNTFIKSKPIVKIVNLFRKYQILIVRNLRYWDKTSEKWIDIN